MKPKTKLEHRVYELSEKLNELTDKQQSYGEDNVFWNYFTVSRNRLFCLECGHKWNEGLQAWQHKAIEEITCPCCKNDLKITGNGNWIKATGYLLIVDRMKEFQVLRYIFMVKHMRKGQEPTYDVIETSQQWILPSGKTTIMGSSRNAFGNYDNTGWRMHDRELSIKKIARNSYSDAYNPHHSAVYPYMKVIPELKRNGFDRRFGEHNGTAMVAGLLGNPKVETLRKMNLTHLFDIAIKRPDQIDKYWDELKITFRNKYIINDFSMWSDYIYMLRKLDKDTLNPENTCPDNLHEAHNILMRRLKAIRLRKDRANEAARIQEKKDNLEMWRVKYPEMRKIFFDFFIEHQNIRIEVFKSVEQFEEEGDILKHCIFENAYYGKEDSLLLSARVDGVVIETIEIDLVDMELIQARGFDNDPSIYNKTIVRLVEENLPTIHKLHRKKVA